MKRTIQEILLAIGCGLGIPGLIFAVAGQAVEPLTHALIAALGRLLSGAG